MKSSHNLLRDWKAARIEKSYLSQVEFLGSSIRTSFLRAWAVTALKVIVIFTLMNLNIDVVSKMEENVALLDSYLRNDYSTLNIVTPLAFAARKPSTQVIVSVNVEPRGPSPDTSTLTNDLPTATVAGESIIEGP